MSDDEFDAYAAEFEGVDFDTIPDLNGSQLQPAAVPVAGPSQRPRSEASSEYEFDDLDRGVLDALDAIEEAAVGSTSGTCNATPGSHTCSLCRILGAPGSSAPITNNVAASPNPSTSVPGDGSRSGTGGIYATVLL